jgi:hypothetical protein
VFLTDLRRPLSNLSLFGPILAAVGRELADQQRSRIVEQRCATHDKWPTEFWTASAERLVIANQSFRKALVSSMVRHMGRVISLAADKFVDDPDSNVGLLLLRPSQ